MEDYKSNSHKSKESAKEPVVEKRVNPVVSGEVKTKKKSGFRKIADALIAEDAASVKTYIFGNVIIPSLKKAISDVVTNALDMFLYGEKGSAHKTSASKISYRGYYEGKRSEPADNLSRYRDGLDYDELEFVSYGDADAVLDGMNDVIEEFGIVSIADFYDLAGVKDVYNYNLNSYGWTSLVGAKILRVGSSYRIKFPTRAIRIDRT